MAKIGIVMGSDSDWLVLEPGYRLLIELGLAVEVLVASAHRNPDEVRHFAEGARGRGFLAIIAGAGLAAHLPGVVASFTTLPVIGVPISGPVLKGLDALLSIVQMPPGIPVGVMAVDGGKNAALFAVAIVAASDQDMAKRLAEFRRVQAGGVRAKNAALQAQLKL
ncbi:MAG: 5-(carboxyamino)imidazole ribonucleotide mutase [Candidatus Adiutrix intracellularis]|jgi:5-(carboxyamino)imidazole ribonucleotide mutase|nr:5-(carboxyamino)imidazole ribonucleotide mutase [Candidatus Adiutrix intracellularis]